MSGVSSHRTLSNPPPTRRPQAHAALLHIASHAATLELTAVEWAPLQHLLARARSARCTQEAMYQPLADFDAFAAELRLARVTEAPSCRREIDGASRSHQSSHARRNRPSSRGRSR